MCVICLILSCDLSCEYVREVMEWGEVYWKYRDDFLVCELFFII